MPIGGGSSPSDVRRRRSGSPGLETFDRRLEDLNRLGNGVTPGDDLGSLTVTARPDDLRLGSRAQDFGPRRIADLGRRCFAGHGQPQVAAAPWEPRRPQIRVIGVWGHGRPRIWSAGAMVSPPCMRLPVLGSTVDEVAEFSGSTVDWDSIGAGNMHRWIGFSAMVSAGNTVAKASESGSGSTSGDWSLRPCANEARSSGRIFTTI
ncbi:hypothetical protein NL676_038844 [Syzygium grande]|nr:hypothetical protein NL676_038844 [Syzygium grande]